MLNYIWAGLIIFSLGFALVGDAKDRWADPAPAAEAAPDAAAVMTASEKFPRLAALTAGAIDSAKKAVEIALGLIGVLALWLGLVRIAEKTELVSGLVRIVQPLLRPLFPTVPKDHPALGMIALNLSANVLGLGNAATPMGLKAMEQLQKLNPSDDTATDPMVMLLAVNTASVQLVPPAMVVAVMGVAANQVIIPIIIVTGLSLVIAIVAAKALARLPMYRRTDPNRNPD